MKPLVVVSVGWRNVVRLAKYSAGVLLALVVAYLAFGLLVALVAGLLVGLVVWGLVRVVRAES
ncbi:hypothetical protein GCM10010174_34930 [Kutzneria viridogrisea]|uniref:Uncharacterized protein n=1 Tax=Kutzneria viridogrisea TaxID=47990 RepID=A0ABR6BLF4_9PSEU|nr:hypothetical protein [Kutzneria viridogrisea]